MKLFFFLLLLAPTLWAQILTEKAVSEKLPGKTVEEAKPYLISKAVLETIKERASDLKLNYPEFEKVLNSRFETHFDKYKERALSQNFGKDFSEKQKEAYLANLETQKKDEFVRYLNLPGVLDSYNFLSLEKSPDDTFKGILSFTLNADKVHALKRRLSVHTVYSKLIILFDLNLLNMGWEDLGLQKASSFTVPVLNSWGKWFQGQLPSEVAEVVLCRDACLPEFYAWEQLPQEQNMPLPESLRDALWLRVTYNLRRSVHAPEVNESKFEWEGNVVLLDANTKKVLNSAFVTSETRTLRGLDQKELNSAIASSLYRSPLDAFMRSKKAIIETPKINRLKRVIVQGQKNLGDVLSLMELLKKEGSSLSLAVTLDSFSNTQAELLCFFHGEEISFNDLLSRLKELKSSYQYNIIHESSGSNNVLKLVTE